MKKNINFYKHDIAPDNTWLNKEYLIQLNLTGKCPRNCDFCYMKKYKNSFLSSSKIKKLWENLRKYNEAYGIEYRVNLTGGDIFEHPECQKIIKFISEESSITAVDPLINKIWTKKQYQILELIKDKINFIQLNSDLVTEKDLLEIKKLGKEIILKIAIYGGDFKSKVKKIKELSEKFDNIIVSIDLIIPQKGNTIKKSNFLIFDKERLKKRISKLKKVFGDKLWLLSTPIKREILKEIYFCPVPFGGIYVMPDGKIVPCSRYSHLNTDFNIDNFDLMKYVEKYNKLCSNFCLFENKYFNEFWEEKQNPKNFVT